MSARFLKVPTEHPNDQRDGFMHFAGLKNVTESRDTCLYRCIAARLGNQRAFASVSWEKVEPKRGLQSQYGRRGDRPLRRYWSLVAFKIDMWGGR